MELVFQVKQTLDELTNDEFVELIKLYGKSYFINVIFHHFKYQFEKVKNLNEFNNSFIPNVKKMNEDAYKFIRKRQSLIDNKENKKKRKLDNLAKEMISNISSFLDLTNLLNFEKTNKRIFIGTRSPSTCKEIDANHFSKCIQFTKKYNINYHWMRFKSVNKISVKIADFNGDPDSRSLPAKKQFKIVDVPIINNITSLTIRNSFLADHGATDRLLRDLSQINLSNINEFCLAGSLIRSSDCTIDTLDSFMNEINSKSNIKSINIQLNDRYLNNILWSNSLKCLSFSVRYPNVNAVLNNIGNKLESFHLQFHHHVDNKIKLSNLKEICLSNPNVSDIKILNELNLKYLKRIHVYRRVFVGLYAKMSNVFAIEMEKLFSLSSLNYICIEVDADSSKYVCKILENVLNNKQFNKLKIKIQYNVSVKKIEMHIIKYLFRFINLFNKNCKHWMLICDLGDNDKINQLVKKYETTHLIECDLITKKYHSARDRYNLVISNDNKYNKCVFQGYNEKWIMNCARCKAKDIKWSVDNC